MRNGQLCMDLTYYLWLIGFGHPHHTSSIRNGKLDVVLDLTIFLVVTIEFYLKAVSQVIGNKGEDEWNDDDDEVDPIDHVVSGAGMLSTPQEVIARTQSKYPKANLHQKVNGKDLKGNRPYHENTLKNVQTKRIASPGQPCWEWTRRLLYYWRVICRQCWMRR